MDNLWKQLDIKQKQRIRDFVSGLIAGVISVTVCNPLDIARTRLNLMSSSSNQKIYKGFRHALVTIWKQQGIRGLFAGYGVNVKAIPIFHSMFFPLYEQTKQFCRKRGFSTRQQSLIASIFAGSFCNIVTNPIWVIRTRIMAQAIHPQLKHYKTDHICKVMSIMVHQEGVSSLFKGVSASVLGVSNAVIYFFIYQEFKHRLVQDRNKLFNSYYVFAASILAKSIFYRNLVIASVATYPFIVLRTIMQDHRTIKNEDLISMTEVFKDVYKKQGIKGFYAGIKPDLLRLLPSNTIVFLVYEFLKRKIKISKSS